MVTNSIEPVVQSHLSKTTTEAAPTKCDGRESAGLLSLSIKESVGLPALSICESVVLPANSLPAASVERPADHFRSRVIPHHQR